MKRLLLSCIILVIAFFIFSGQAFAADVDGSNWFCFRGKNDDGSFITLKDTLDTMRSFLRDHPTEALLVSVRCEFDDSDYSTNVWAGIKETVQEYSDFLYMENNWPTLDQLRGKALLCT